MSDDAAVIGRRWAGCRLRARGMDGWHSAGGMRDQTDPRRSGLAAPGEAAPWRAVPAEVAGVIGPGLVGVVDDIIAAVREQVPEYGQPLEGEFGRLLREGVTAALHQFVELLGHDVDLPEVGIYEAIGRAELRAGRTLDALQSAYRVGARVAWRAAVAHGEATLEPRVLFAVAEALFAYIDRLADASVAGYAQEQSVREGSAQARRHALVELLVRGPVVDEPATRSAAEHAGWPVPALLAVMAVGESDPVALARRMPQGTIAASLDPVGLLVVPDPDAPDRRPQLGAALRGQRGVLGPTVSWEQAYYSARRALAGWRLHAAGRLGDVPLACADDHLLALALTADERLAGELVAARLRPLATLAPPARRRAEATLVAWLDAHGDVSQAARALHVHPQTVRQRLAALRAAFGPALDDAAARLEIAVALMARELLD
ncbi:MAG: PucR family transcriptional regulator [Solirubrobacteraceae bacterium]